MAKKKQTPEASQRELISLWLEDNFTNYQRRWIAETAPIAVALKARQIGFSDAEGGDCVLSGFVMRRPQLILSASEDLAAEVLAKSRLHCETLAAIGFPEAMDFKTDNDTELAWRSGGRIVALSSNPRTARSFSGDVHLDEFAYHQDAEAVREGAFPMASRGNWRIKILSTPNGATGLFYEYCKSPPKGWGFHRVTVQDAVRDGFPVDMGKLMDLCGGDERLFAQWYECEFLDSDLQYFPTELVDAAFVAPTPPMPNLSQCELFAGLDVGRVKDLTSLTIVAKAGNRVAHVNTFEWKRTEFSRQRSAIRKIREQMPWVMLHMDATGIGNQMAEEFVEEFGRYEARPVTFTNPIKEELATRVYSFLRDGRLHIRKNEQGAQLRREIIAVRRKVTKSGSIQYEVPRTREGHGDRFWSLALALKGADEKQLPRGLGDRPLLAVA